MLPYSTDKPRPVSRAGTPALLYMGTPAALLWADGDAKGLGSRVDHTMASMGISSLLPG